jgi:quinol monooxygenase YgiN
VFEPAGTFHENGLPTPQKHERSTMSEITVVAKLSARKDSVEAVKAELLKLIIPTRKESGCIEYNLHQDNEDPAVFIFYETWENSASLEQHKNAHHYKAYVREIDGMIDEKVVHKMTRIG